MHGLDHDAVVFAAEYHGPSLRGSVHADRRAPGTALVFPKKQDGEWTRSHFHKLVWKKATAGAARLWRERNKLADTAATPFDSLQVHDLRSTAATLMRQAGVTKDEAAARLGHADTGQLLDRVYDRGDRSRPAARALDKVAQEGLRAPLAAEALPRPSGSTAPGGPTYVEG